MENASKALLMAAGVLVGIMILTIAVYLFSSFGGTSSQIQDNIRKNQIAQFNSQFTKYQGKDNVTIYDVITMANLATENNQYYGFTKRSSLADIIRSSDYYIAVYLQGYNYIECGTETSTKEVEEIYNRYISSAVNDISDTNIELKKYTVQTEINTITERVYIVTCTESS